MGGGGRKKIRGERRNKWRSVGRKKRGGDFLKIENGGAIDINLYSQIEYN